MNRPAASLTPQLVRRPRSRTFELPVAVPAPARWREDLRWFLWAWAAGFLAFLLFLG